MDGRTNERMEGRMEGLEIYPCVLQGPLLKKRKDYTSSQPSEMHLSLDHLCPRLKSERKTNVAKQLRQENEKGMEN